MSKVKTFSLRLFYLSLVMAFTSLGIVIAGYLYLEPKLPQIDMLSDIQLQVPLRVYSRNGELIGEFGEKKRIPLQFDAFPDLLVKAVLAAEDDRFYEHPGIDYQGLLRAAYQLIKTGEKGQGGSTITMQVARNFFLSKEKTFLRKFNEILLSLKIEKELTKNNILELYLNKIYLGKRSYGMAAAAQVYYGKDINDLSIAEMAMLAGLPKAPSAYNPIVNPDRAKLRRDYVLKRMYTLGMITQEQYNHEKEAAVTAKQHSVDVELPAPFIAEMVRSYMVDLYGDNAYTNGYHVFTTVDPKSQRAASAAVIKNLLEYDYRHGYRGAESHIELTGDETPDTLKKHLNNYPSVGPLQAALVIAIADKEADVITKEGQIIKLLWSSFEWARSYIDHNTQGDLPVTVTDVVNIGDIIRIDNSNEVLKVSQLPTVGGALVSINANNGQLIALVGGFDFYFSKFNRVTQALRQPGSNLKPFIYSAALANGYNPASLINDAPVVFDDDKLESEWRPENYSGKIYGPTRLREALVRSRNLVSIRLLQSIGISTAIKHLEKFGFNKNQLPHDLSLALGSASVTPYQLIQGYAVIANGGYMIEPHFISQILDDNGQLVSNPSFQIACSQCDVLDSNISPTPGFDKAPMDNDNLSELRKLRLASRQVDERNIFLIQNIMQDVIKQGTGRKARSLGRKDLAGKTGTTNEQHDAWFSGYNSNIVATAWIGFDNPRPLGNRETGAGAALPMWIDYMRYALEGEPERSMVQPSKMVSVRIDSLTGKYTTANNPKAIFEIFREENAPQPEPDQIIHNRGTNTNSIDETITEELF